MENGKTTEAAEEPGRSGNRRLPELNEARVVGRMVNQPKMKEGASAHGTYKMARFTLAVNRSYKDSSGQWVRETDFIPVVAWGKEVDALGNAGKGTALRVSGRIKTWQVEGKNYRWELKADELEILDFRAAGAAPASEDRKMQAAGEGAEEQQEEMIRH